VRRSTGDWWTNNWSSRSGGHQTPVFPLSPSLPFSRLDACDGRRVTKTVAAPASSVLQRGLPTRLAFPFFFFFLLSEIFRRVGRPRGSTRRAGRSDPFLPLLSFLPLFPFFFLFFFSTQSCTVGGGPTEIQRRQVISSQDRQGRIDA